MRNQKVIIGAVLVSLVGVLVLYRRHAYDPAYKGKRLSEYLLSAASTVNGFSFGGSIWEGRLDVPPEPAIIFFSQDSEAAEAVANVGTNALPMLVRLLGYKESRTRECSSVSEGNFGQNQGGYELRFPMMGLFDASCEKVEHRNRFGPRPGVFGRPALPLAG